MHRLGVGDRKRSRDARVEELVDSTIDARSHINVGIVALPQVVKEPPIVQLVRAGEARQVPLQHFSSARVDAHECTRVIGWLVNPLAAPKHAAMQEAATARPVLALRVAL